MRRLRGGLASAAVVCALMLPGCSGVTTNSPSPHPGRSELKASGPWADDFRAALDDDVSDFESNVLSDGVVTPEELEATHDRVQRCLADSGFGIDYDADGGFALRALDERYPDDFFERSDPVLRACEQQSDEYITYLFGETRRNPDRLDEAKITVSCLRTAGLVGDDYSEQRWRSDQSAGAFPFDETADAAVQCRLDPLGLWRTP
ncbi:hypothetical protein [Curtobacterium sp. NPDC089689]|uniref:hypothetical protein n=1 Tax=Curtobacterium sp. NPDC089689 TaxID=3363968 RepID=UPI003803F259